MAADLKEEYKGFRGLNALYRRLVAKQFTAVADFHNVLRTRFLRLRFLLDGKAVAHINKHKQGKKLLCREENKVFIQQPTSFQNYADASGRLVKASRGSLESYKPKMTVRKVMR